MSDLDFIIPLGLILAVALFAGGGGGGQASEEIYRPKEPKHYLIPSQERALGIRRQSITSVMTTRTEQRFQDDKPRWEYDPRQLVEMAERTMTELNQERVKLQNARVNAQEEQNKESGERLSKALSNYVEYYAGKGHASLANFYAHELEATVDELTESLDDTPGPDYEWKGGGQRLSAERRSVLIQQFLELKHALSSFEDDIQNEISTCRIILDEVHDPTEEDIPFDQESLVSKLEGYAVSESPSFAQKVIGVHETPRFEKTEDLKPEVSWEDNLVRGTPQIPEPATYFAKPTKSVETIARSSLKRIAEHHVMLEHPQTPTRRTQSKAKGSPHFERIVKMVRGIPTTSEFNQGPSTPAFADEPEDEEFTSDEEDQMGLYSRLSLDSDSTSIVDNSASAQQARNLTSFLNEAAKRDIDTSVSRGLINQGKATRDVRALDTIKANLIASNKKITALIDQYPKARIKSPWRIQKKLEFVSPFKVARTPIRSQTRFKDDVRKSVKNTRALSASKNISQLEESLERLKELAPEGFSGGSWYQALISTENLIAENENRFVLRFEPRRRL